MGKYDHREIEKKLYLILVCTGCMANVTGAVANGLIYGATRGTLFCAICAVLLIAVGIWGLFSDNQKKAEFFILILAGYIEFPFLYYVYGKSTFVYMILGIVAIVTFADGLKREIMLALEILIGILTIVFAHVKPSTLANMTEADTLFTALCSYLIVAISVSMLLLLLVGQYKKQQYILIKMGEELESMAKMDPLTETYNRRYLAEYIEERINNPDSSIAIALLDLDDFKQINDCYGHLYGDDVLKTFAEIIKKNVAGQGIAARFGGEEFMMVFQHTDQERIQEILDRTAQELNEYSMEKKGVKLSFSGGVELIEKEDSVTSIFNAADEKLYCAKAEGKNRVVF